MNFKKYKSLNQADKKNEAYYIIGLDVGNDSSAIAYYNFAENRAEAIDLSGGYGKPSIPTVMQYISETKEWVFGEYAVLNTEAGTVFGSFLTRMGQFDYVDVDGRSHSVASVFALFIKELLGNVKNINPKAEIVGIVASIPAYFSAQARSEFERVFKLAGYEKELIALVPDRECVLAHHYEKPPENEGRVLLVDLGSRELRGGLYNISPAEEGISAVSMSSVFDSSVSLSAITKDVCKLFGSFLPGRVPENPAQGGFDEQLTAFTYQHKDILFQKNIRTKPVKLYYNFVYPPFQQALDYETVEALISPYAKRFDKFIKNVLEKNLYEREVSPAEVDAVLCVGGGFDMLWAKEAVTSVFGNVFFYKNPKLVTAEGAAKVAAHALDVAGFGLTIEDKHQLTHDIGIADGENFLTLVEKNGFWWQKHSAKLVLVNREVQGDLELHLSELNEEGEGRELGIVHLDGLPNRPKGVTRLEILPNFISNTELTLSVRDLGFGDLFPQTDYRREFALKIG